MPRMQTTTVLRRTREGWQRRTRLDFDLLMSMEEAIAAITRTPTSIKRMHEYWRSRTTAGRAYAANFDPAHDLGGPEELGITFSQVDVALDNPWHYRFTSYTGRYFSWMHGKCLAEFPLPPVVDDCALEYYECKSAGRPVAHHIQHDLNGFSRDYLRLLLPLSGKDGSLAALVSVGRHLAIPDPAESSPTIRPGSTRP